MSLTDPAKNRNQVWRTDWLNVKPVFYNTQTKEISHNVNEVIDFENIEIHPEGFNNYLDAGYSILGQTPVKHVKFLPPHSEIRLTEDDDLEITTLPDPAEDYIDYRLSEIDIIDLIREKLAIWEQSIEGPITIPLSGGCDSRFLTSLMPDKTKIRAYTYGFSPKQEACFEVVIAKALCKKLGIHWQQIELGDFHQYFDEWNRLFGVSIHSHGLYHIEFYQKIINGATQEDYHLLSGIGGSFATFKEGVYPDIRAVGDINNLMRFHGMKADSMFSKFSGADAAKREYFEKNFEKLKHYRFRKIEMMRFAMPLMGFLVRLPEAYGMCVRAPLLDIDVANAMLNLPDGRRDSKKWMRDYFRKEGIDFSDLSAKYPYKNTLNFQAIKKIPPAPLNRELFKDIIKEPYIDWINRNLTRFSKAEDLYWGFTRLPKINRVLKWVNIVDERKKAYFAYLTLKPLEYLLKKQSLKSGK